MKNITFFAIVITSLFLLSACSKSIFFGTTVEVEVVNLFNLPVKGGTIVYLFKDSFTIDSKASDAKKQAVTNDEGVASFRLNFKELNIFESETSLYFAVFYNLAGKEHMAGSSAIAVRNGVTERLRLKVPI